MDACEWLRSLGVFHVSNRFATYLKLIEGARHGRSEMFDADQRFLDYVTALAEASELIRTKKALQQIDSDNYLTQLKAVTSGKAFKSVAGADPGRDFAFELATAARFIAGGYTVEVNSIADAVVELHGRKLFVECKRVQSEGQVMKRLSHARDQLATRMKANPSSKTRGLIACRLTEVLNPGGRSAVLPSPADFRRVSEVALQGYVRLHEAELKGRIGVRQLGILFENSLHGVLYDSKDPASEPAFMNCRGATLYHRGLGAEDEKLLKEIAPAISNQNVL